MKRQSIFAWAIAIVFSLLIVSAQSAQAGVSKEGRSVRLVEQLKSRPVVEDAEDVGAPEVQYGDPDDLGGGDGKTKPTPPVGNPDGNGSTTSGALSWYTALLMQLAEFFRLVP